MMTMRSIRIRARLCFLAVSVLFSASCGARDRTDGAEITLEEIGRYGWASEQQDPSGTLPSDAGLLGDVRAVAVGSDESVYVLDADWNRIVVFAPDRSVSRVIPFSIGSGPGEILLARDLFITGEGKLAVLDYQKAQVLVFSPTGDFESAIQLERTRPMLFEMSDDTVWVTTGVSPGSESPSLWALSMSGELLGSGPEPGAEDLLFGQSVALALTPDGSLVQSKILPGQWLRFNGLEATEHGVALFPDLEPPEVTVSGNTTYIGLPRATALGIGVLPDGTVVQSHAEYSFSESSEPIPTPESMRVFISFYREEGETLGRVPLQPGEGQAWVISPTSGSIYISTTEPYPAIVEYRITGL